jgi:cytochrome c biogenesis protein CcmG/thiol:disulfide interchange protein DsbE
MKRYLIPLVLFLGLMILLAAGLRLNPREVPSPFIGKPAPAFNLDSLQDPGRAISSKDMAGKVWLLNVWASWCAACRDEHPALLDLSRKGVAPIIGLNYKDKREDGIAWLAQFGDPYQSSVFDGDGRLGIEYGVYGVPETFVVDKAGVIRLKHTGALTPQFIEQKLLPLIRELQRA